MRCNECRGRGRSGYWFTLCGVLVSTLPSSLFQASVPQYGQILSSFDGGSLMPFGLRTSMGLPHFEHFKLRVAIISVLSSCNSSAGAPFVRTPNAVVSVRRNGIAIGL